MDLLQVWRQWWPAHLAAAVMTTTACLAIMGLWPTLVPAAPGPRTLAYAILYGIAIWSWSFGLIGLAVRFLAHADTRIRYIADASYWIYLVHLPVVAALQVVVGHLPWHWSVKFPLVNAAAFAILLVSYRYLVRATFIGQLLNGRRYPAGERRPAPVEGDGLRSAMTR
jgi:peptidoglycan/LPS O-acetylase OafA/YrhL